MAQGVADDRAGRSAPRFRSRKGSFSAMKNALSLNGDRAHDDAGGRRPFVDVKALSQVEPESSTCSSARRSGRRSRPSRGCDPSAWPASSTSLTGTMSMTRGNLITRVYVDFRDPVERFPIPVTGGPQSPAGFRRCGVFVAP